MPSEWENNSSSSSTKVSSSSASSLSASSSTATSPEPNANGNNNNNNDSAKNGHGKDCALKASTMSHDPTPYVARARVTRPTPPKPSCNPMQFVQIKPCNLYQSAQQQLKKAEEVKKVKEVLKEEPEDWQNNLDNWKSSRRKRVEHIIDRVVEVKKLEQEEHDRTRRKSKTFSEMMEERGERGRARPKLQSLASYNEDEANDLSDLGIGTSSASGKSSISEDCEVHSIVSEPAEVENLSSFDIENNSCQPCHDNHNRDRISSPGYETSSTAPVASPDPYEYTYEGAIEDYKSRVSKATASSIYKKPGFGENSINKSLVFERKQNSIDCDNDTESSVVTVKKEDLPKIDISKKRELFEKPEITKKPVTQSSMQNNDQIEKKRIPSEFVNVRSIKDRLCSLEKKPESVEEPTTGILSGEITSIKERLQCLEQQKQQNSVNPKPNTNKVVAEVVAVPPLKDRLSSLQNAVTKEEIVKKPVVLVDEYQLEMLKNEELARRQLDTNKDDSVEKAPSDDSGINTTDEKIDQEPATTEDEDDDEQEEEEEGRDGRPTQMHQEKLKNLNTPTVVSLVDKPVVVDVGGGNTLFNSSKVVRNDEDGGEVNYAQNLLRMFKMAFNEDDIVEESATPKAVLENVDRKKVGDIEHEKKQESEIKVQESRVPWRKNVESSESKVKASKIPQGSAYVRDSPINPVEENIKKSVVQASKIPQGVSKKQVPSSKTEQDIEIPLSSQNSSDITEIVKKALGRPPAFEKVTSIEEILNESLPVGEETSDSTPNTNEFTVKPLESSEKSSKPQESSILSPKVQVEAQSTAKTVPPNSRYGAKPHDLVTNLILNIDNSQKKSMIPVAPKVQPTNTKTTDAQSPKLGTPSSAPVSASKLPNSKTDAVSPVFPKTPSIASVSPQKTPNFTSKCDAQPPKLDVSSLSSSAGTSPQKSPNFTPIYENVQFDVDIPRPNPCVGLKRVSSPQNNGRVEIFNSKSMSPKPKSPEVLPRMNRNNPSENLKSEVQTKDFQQSAMNDFFKDLETWQPKIVGEKPKQSVETAPIVNVAKKPLNDSQTSKENVEISSNPQSPEKVAPITNAKETFEIPSSLQSPENLSIVSKKSSNGSQIFEEIPKTVESSSNLPSISTDVQISEGIKQPLESNSNVQSPEKSVTQPTDPLPFESCVDILQSFLAAERAYPAASSNESPHMKKSNQTKSGPSEGFLRQETIVEVPCSKIDVKDLPDPNFIRTPCIDVDCTDRLIKDSIKSPQTQIRDSVSSAGDSSPSSEITVIFKPNKNPAPTCPGSPTPNKSSLMQIANRVNSPIAGRRDPLSRQQPICEKPCLKIDVKDLPDPNFIKTQCIEVDKKTLRECAPSSRPNSPTSPTTPSSLLQTNAEVLRKTCDALSNSPPLSPVLGSPTVEKPNFLIARVEVVETKIKVTTTNDAEAQPPAVPTSAPPPVLPGSPKLKPKSAQNSKPKNIFEFLKKNFQSKPDAVETASEPEEFEPISVDNSMFYVPSDVINSSTIKDSSPLDSQANNGVNIEITKTITTDAIVEQTDSELNLTDEINEILDEEISKLVVEDAKL